MWREWEWGEVKEDKKISRFFFWKKKNREFFLLVVLPKKANSRAKARSGNDRVRVECASTRSLTAHHVLPSACTGALSTRPTSSAQSINRKKQKKKYLCCCCLGRATSSRLNTAACRTIANTTAGPRDALVAAAPPQVSQTCLNVSGCGASLAKKGRWERAQFNPQELGFGSKSIFAWNTACYVEKRFIFLQFQLFKLKWKWKIKMKKKKILF